MNVAAKHTEIILSDAYEVMLESHGGYLLLIEIESLERLSRLYPQAFNQRFRQIVEGCIDRLASALSLYGEVDCRAGWSGEYLLVGVRGKTPALTEMVHQTRALLETIKVIDYATPNGTEQVFLNDMDCLIVGAPHQHFQTVEQVADDLMVALEHRRALMRHEHALWSSQPSQSPSPWHQAPVRVGKSNTPGSRLIQQLTRLMSANRLSLQGYVLSNEGFNRSALRFELFEAPKMADQNEAWSESELRQMCHRLGLNWTLDTTVIRRSLAITAAINEELAIQGFPSIERVQVPMTLHTLKSLAGEERCTRDLALIIRQAPVDITAHLIDSDVYAPRKASERQRLANWISEVKTTLPGFRAMVPASLAALSELNALGVDEALITTQIKPSELPKGMVITRYFTGEAEGDGQQNNGWRARMRAPITPEGGAALMDMVRAIKSNHGRHKTGRKSASVIDARRRFNPSGTTH